QGFVEIGKQDADFYLTIWALVTSSTSVGLDDIQLLNHSCPILSTEFCDFETNGCDWSGNMTVKQASSEHLVDHTTQTGNGHFLQDTGVGVSVMEKNISSLPFFIKNSVDNYYQHDFCLNLYYYF